MSKILLIEDEEPMGRMITSYLRSRLLDWVKDGTEGLEQLRTEAYDAAITDWNLPGLAGSDLVRHYRDKGGSTPIIMLTGRNELKGKSCRL
jgi:two-component system, OmpR family, response regulator